MIQLGDDESVTTFLPTYNQVPIDVCFQSYLVSGRVLANRIILRLVAVASVTRDGTRGDL